MPALTTSESLLHASVRIKGDNLKGSKGELESCYRALAALQQTPEGDSDLGAKLLQRPVGLDLLQKEGKTWTTTVLATQLRGFFCAGAFYIVHAEVEPSRVLNWGKVE